MTDSETPPTLYIVDGSAYIYRAYYGMRRRLSNSAGLPTNAIYAFVTLRTGETATEEMKGEIIKAVRNDIGPHATPEKIQFTDGLPKTRSGKIMRRILRKIAEGDVHDLGDTSTLADPGVVDSLVSGRV